MKFAVVIFETEKSRRLIAEDRAAFRGHYETWIGEIAAAGKLLGGEAFDTDSVRGAPATIRTDSDGATTVVSGPACAGPETLGGWFVIDAADREEAIGLARRLQTPETIEIRPILESA